MRDEPLVSVVIGICNAGPLLAPTLEPILGLPDLGLELIAVDDGSTDSTAALLDSLAKDDARVRVFHQANAGLTSALVRGCLEARGKYIARQDIGDRSLPARLPLQARLLNENPDVVMVTCGYRLVGPEGEILYATLPRHSPDEWTGILRGGDVDRLYGPHHGSVMFRKSAYDAVGGYRPEFYFAQDLDLWTRLAVVGTLDYVPEVLYEVGFRYDSLSARYGVQQRQLRQIIAEATRRRGRGEGEDNLLREAASIRKPLGSTGDAGNSFVDADYFIGSCLAGRKNPAARRYLRRVLSRNPLHAKAWAKLLRSYMARAGVGQ